MVIFNNLVIQIVKNQDTIKKSAKIRPYELRDLYKRMKKFQNNNKKNQLSFYILL